ncbi:Lactonase, 7-bladed beta-propeller-domain-containing protein [Desarmillaria tabescens]|uniref:Lactonase, 7-bladed beta-propeller-domain-containing protein n=1 Tax=Armillaria tabescens TaxID=1929756 RepID=A0AA39JHW0_ARMTA|nr:Lactonase, 7-bladed beta-propeller-domain-containing protein [Desarmillaria tabescens]KAK0443065.1 Lactonase, 7-bladed beta-propeller-domain-containing protein [Desarmillaria tabescens]
MDIHVLSGSFTSFSLFLLAFSPLNRSLRLLRTVPAIGPHQYITQTPQAVYATTWASPPALHAWSLPSLAHIGSTPITATSSYITILDSHAYSMGGPTGEIHTLDPATGAWKKKIQEILFVESGKLDEADKTRKALRYGSHAIEFTADGNYGFVPVLGTEEIHVFKRGNNGTLERVAKSKGHAGDGPRHVKIHPNGEVVYCVTEHSNKLVVYTFNTAPTPSLKLPLYASGSSRSYRGDTLLLAPSAKQIFATARRATHLDPGYISVFSLSSSGLLSGQVEYYETPTSGGKAHAIDLLPKASDSLSIPAESLWIVLTDDDPCTQAPEPCASVRILEWDGWDTGGIREVAAYSGTEMQGGSHAIFLRADVDAEEVVRHDEL